MKSCRILICLLLLLAGVPALAQRDSLTIGPDSASALIDTGWRAAADTARRDTLVIPPVIVVQRRYDSLVNAAHPFFPYRNPVRLREAVHQFTGKEALFYCAAVLFLLFAIARNAFGRYLQDLFRIFFLRASFKQRQAKEQLQQTPVPSIYMNILFVLSGALFLVLLFQRFGLGGNFSFWQLLGYTAAGLGAIYLGKYLLLRLMGWIFRVPAATDAYLFIIFTANKIIGIVLLPIIVLLGFAGGTLGAAALTLGLLVAGALFAYRYFLSWVTVQRQVRLGFLHFLLYFLAFELAPLLLINKLLFRLLG